MAGKKNRPALYEVLKKGTIRPDEKGSLQTPKWFYGQKKQTVEPVRKETKIVTKQATEEASFPVRTIQPPETKPKVKSGPIRQDEKQTSEKLFSLQLARKKLQVTAPYWVGGLLLLGLLLSHLVMYRAGQSGEPTAATPAERTEQGLADAKPNPALEEVRNGPVRQGLLPPQAANANPQSGGQQTAQANAQLRPEVEGMRLTAEGELPRTPEQQTTSPTIPAAPAMPTGNCLVLCGHENHRALRPAQEYFNQRGVSTEIGRFNNRYVLFSKDTFESSREASALKLKNLVAQLGLHYNSEKPRGALSFTAETFRSSFWVRRDRVRSVDE